MRPYVFCKNPKPAVLEEAIRMGNFGATAIEYKDEYVNEQYRDVKKEKIARLYSNTARAKTTRKISCS